MEDDRNKVLKRKMPGTGDELSILGYGCMRFTRKLSSVDVDKAEEEVAVALAAGVNYFDTAYFYPGNEKAVGAILNKTDELGKRRDRVFVATKLPVMLVNSREDMDRFLNTSLERLGMDYVDYYLMHNLSGFAAWERAKNLDADEFLAKAKADGKVRHVGFSWHGNLDDFRKVADDYPWEFCQIQYNLLDENFQAGTEGMKYVHEKNMGIIVMEPLRGGMIVNKTPPAAKKIVEEYADEQGTKKSIAEWGLRWVWNHPEISVVLSGMNEVPQVEENVRVAADALANQLSEADIAMIESVRDIFHETIRVDCTGCAYCMPCPFGVDIPNCFAYYNSYGMFGGFSTKINYAFNLRGGKGKSNKASACKNCGACEKKCPQMLPIRKHLAETAAHMENPAINVGMKIAGLFLR
jgi:predicted aldo/keto reductase-like oxidoreductase